MREVDIVPFRPELAEHFRTINEQWINSMFAMETLDQAILEDPQGYIIDRGGQVWFAAVDDLGIVGTCALLRHQNNAIELTKMGVLESARGLKVGEKLLKRVIEEAMHCRPDLLFLLTNRKCAPAIHLYEKNGFVHCPEVMARYADEYARCNVAMRYVPGEPCSL